MMFRPDNQDYDFSITTMQRQRDWFTEHKVRTARKQSWRAAILIHSILRSLAETNSGLGRVIRLLRSPFSMFSSETVVRGSSRSLDNRVGSTIKSGVHEIIHNPTIPIPSHLPHLHLKPPLDHIPPFFLLGLFILSFP
ncbi:hypothetical protein PMIN07_010257 [Paraphaeosphaeria minitans]